MNVPARRALASGFVHQHRHSACEARSSDLTTRRDTAIYMPHLIYAESAYGKLA
jgi:hypothetical protein